MLQTFHEMWAELLEELVYGILDHPTIESVHSLNHWNLVVCEDIAVKSDPQKPLELVSDKAKSECVTLQQVSIAKNSRYYHSTIVAVKKFNL